MENDSDMNGKLMSGVSLFNCGRYFDAHEVWEDLWKCAGERYALLFKALAQLSVSLEHARRGNLNGASRVGYRSLSLLREQRDRHKFTWLEALLDQVEQYLRALGRLPSLQEVRLPEELRSLPLEGETLSRNMSRRDLRLPRKGNPAA